MLLVGVLRLHAVEVAVDAEGWLREEAIRAEKEAFVSDLIAKKGEVDVIPPGIAVRAGDGFPNT